MDDKKVPTRINAELIYYQLAEIKTQLQDFKVNYVTKEESHALKLEIEGLRTDLADYKRESSAEIRAVKNSKTIVGWLYPTLSAAFTALFTYLIIKYFDGL